MSRFPNKIKGRKNLEWMLAQADSTDRQEGISVYGKYNLMMNRYAKAYQLPVEKVTAAFCALSPNNDYVGNLRSLTSVIEGLQSGVDRERITISTYNHCRDRAIRYLLGEEEFDTLDRGPKILSFYHNILYPQSPHWVTVDGHVAAAYAGDPKLVMKDVLMTKNQYQIIRGVINNIAVSQNLIPNQLQAIVWFTRKRLYKIKYTPVVDMFAEPDDIWRTVIPLDELPAYSVKGAPK